MSFQLIKLDIQADSNIACPHCQHNIINWAEEQYVQPCPHTLFVAFDLGFEYISDAYESTMQRSVDDVHAHDIQINILEDLKQATYLDYVVYQSDLGAADMSRYIGISATAIDV